MVAFDGDIVNAAQVQRRGALVGAREAQFRGVKLAGHGYDFAGLGQFNPVRTIDGRRAEVDSRTSLEWPHVD